MNLLYIHLYRIPVFSVGKCIMVFGLYAHHSIGRKTYDSVLIVIFNVAEAGLPESHSNKSSLSVILAFNIFFSTSVYIIRIQLENPEVSLLLLFVLDTVDKKLSLFVKLRLLSEENKFLIVIFQIYALHISGNFIECAVSYRIGLFRLFVFRAGCRQNDGKSSNNYSFHNSRYLLVTNTKIQKMD